MLCIVAPPRSGSTLTYQILTRRLNNSHLTNLWNLLYATPALGALVSKVFCGKYISSFKSQNGFVPGACGESEGMRFWTHWCGQGLVENAGGGDEIRLNELLSILQKVCFKETFITGYLGHVFCMELLRNIFPKIIFVHVTRDLLSNSFSLYQRSSNGWFSLSPEATQGTKFSSTHEQVVEQLFCLHDIIIRNSNPSDTIQIRYEDLCDNPEQIIEKIVNFGMRQGIEFKEVLHKLPDFYKQTVIDTKNSDIRRLQKIIRNRILDENENLKFFQSLNSNFEGTDQPNS